MLSGLGSETVRWRPVMLASGSAPPPVPWQVMHCESSAWGTPVGLARVAACGTRPAGTVAAKLTLSWQAPQARRLAWFFQLSTGAAGAGAAACLWHLVQLRMSCG